MATTHIRGAKPILAALSLVLSLSLVPLQPVYAAGGVVITQQCSLSSSVISSGTTLTATGTLQNLGTSSVKLRDVVLAGRPPLGTHEGGPYDDFAPDTSGNLGQGQSLTLTASRNFSAADPVGAWICFLTYE